MNQNNKLNENFYRDLFKKIPNLVLILGQNGVVLNCNDRIEPLLGFKRGEVVDKNLVELVHPDYRAKIRQKLTGSEKSDGFYGSYIEFVKASGERIGGNVQITGISRGKRQHKRQILLFEEITERQLEKLKTKLSRIRTKNRNLEELLQTIFHDLQEPVRSIGAYMDILASKYESDLPEPAHDRIRNVKNNAKRMESLMSDLSEISRLGITGSPELLDIKEMVGEIRKEFENEFGEFVLEVQENFPKISCNPSQMKILLRNLISNGLKFNSNPRELFVGYEKSPPGENIKLFVRDNGFGIPEEYHSKVFEIFEVLNPGEARTGTGAGLAISKRIVKNNGGEIWLNSEEETGTAVYFTVPIYEEGPQEGEFFSQFSLPKTDPASPNSEEAGLFDDETGLHNRRYFDQILEPHLKRYCKQGHRITFLAIKISPWEEIKSGLGKKSYPESIEQLAGRLRGAIRNSDLILRLSEKLFLVILPRMTGSLYEVKERFRDQLNYLNESSHDPDGPLTLNFGSFILDSQEKPDPERAIKSAERDLYDGQV